MNKKLTIFLIVLLSIICIALIVFMVMGMNDKTRFLFGHRVSTELVVDEIYDKDFKEIYIKSNAGDISVLPTNDNFRVVVYGDKESTNVEENSDKLSVISKQQPCRFFCFNTSIQKIEVYVPQNYNGNIEIINNYGDIDIGDLNNAYINIEEDCGDVKVINGYNVTISNNYGDIDVNKAEILNMKEKAGDIKIGYASDVTVDNNYGDIDINKVGNYLDITNNCGDIEINEVNLNKNSFIKDDLGNIKIGTINEVFIDAKTDLGNVKIGKNHNSDIILKIENSCGDIKVSN
ncbi:MAG: DUF4097 domain-containing protein [Clostridium sp.]|nr:DUF4097 domain-containing protein [Clostridium sp.]MCM1444704.1 DUF4097 domain-containing protein [Candidatus Amulumruptor caecigallinarius]